MTSIRTSIRTSIITNDEEWPESPKLNKLTSSRNLALKKSILDYKNSVPYPSSLHENEVNSFISSIVVPINDSPTLTEYDLEKEDWESLLTELKSPSERQDSLTERENLSKTIQDKTKNDIARKYGGDKKRNALMTILVCHPPLEVVKLIVELGGNDTVVKVDCGCGMNAIHYACWGNASLEVIKYLLDIGGKESLLHKSKNGGANPLHQACIRYNTTKSNSLRDVIRLLIEVGGQDVITATDFNGEFPLQGLLLRPNIPMESVITFFEKWDDNISDDFDEKEILSGRNINDNFTDEEVELLKKCERDEAFINTAFNKITDQLSEMNYSAQGQILKLDFIRKYLTEKFIEPFPLAILIMDLYIQGLIVCVFSFFINNTSPNPVESTTTVIILYICFLWRVVRELMQLMNTPFGNYINDIFNWFDIMQIVCIILTIRMDFDDHSEGTDRSVLIIATFVAWFELLLELHNFCYDLAIFVVATFKIMQRLGTFLFTTLIFVAAFAHVQYIAGTHDEDFCNNPDNITEAEFNSEGGFTCTRIASYIYSVSNLFTFEIPTGVPILLPLMYAFVMLMLVLNVVIAVIIRAFEEVLNESEMSFWSSRLSIVKELTNESGSFFTRIACIFLPSFPKLKECKLPKCNQCFLKHEHERLDLSSIMPNRMWDEVKDKDKDFIHWWYGKNEGSPSFSKRLTFFMTKSCLKDIFIPGNVFENVVLGYDRSHKLSKSERFCILPFSVLFMVVSNSVLLVVFILGWMSFGLLWPKTLKWHLFFISTEKKGDMSDMNPDMRKMHNENNSMRKEIKNMREEILAEIKSIKS